jgi:signal transduction protein with GAF and PtsI domain
MESKDVQIHIHEHVAPIRERMSKIEGRLEGHEKELALLRQSLESLRDRVDSVKSDVLAGVDRNHAEIIETFRTHDDIDHEKDDEISRKVSKVADAQALCAERLAGLKAWIIGIGLGASAIVIALQFLQKLHAGGL